MDLLVNNTARAHASSNSIKLITAPGGGRCNPAAATAQPQAMNAAMARAAPVVAMSALDAQLAARPEAASSMLSGQIYSRLLIERIDDKQ